MGDTNYINFHLDYTNFFITIGASLGAVILLLCCASYHHKKISESITQCCRSIWKAPGEGLPGENLDDEAYLMDEVHQF